MIFYSIMIGISCMLSTCNATLYNECSKNYLLDFRFHFSKYWATIPSELLVLLSLFSSKSATSKTPQLSSLPFSPATMKWNIQEDILQFNRQYYNWWNGVCYLQHYLPLMPGTVCLHSILFFLLSVPIIWQDTFWSSS